MKTLILTICALIVIGGLVGFLGKGYGFARGYAAGCQEGYDLGYEIGRSDGYYEYKIEAERNLQLFWDEYEELRSNYIALRSDAVLLADRLNEESDKPPVIIEIPVEVIKEIEVIKDVPIPLNDWESLEELKQFLEEDNTDTCVYATTNEQGVIIFDECCVDQAEHLRDEAAEIGRDLEVIPLTPMEYRRIFGVSKKEYHAACMARIGDYFYAVEPDNDMVKRAYRIP